MIFLLKHWRILLFLAITLASTYWGYSAGIDSVKADQLATLQAYATQNKELAADLEAEKANVKIKTIETVRMIESAQDPSGCIDTPIPDGLLSSFGDSPGRPLSNN